MDNANSLEATNRGVEASNPSFADYVRRVFNPSWYLAQNPDVAQAEVDPLQHWLADGFRERRLAAPDLEVIFEPPVPATSEWSHFIWQTQSVWVRETVALKTETPPLFAPPGHYYSPIVDPDLLRANKHFAPTATSQIHGIDLNYGRMTGYFLRLQQYFQDYRYTEASGGELRYYWGNEFFGQGDALVLYSIVRTAQPKVIIEVGSGLSTAVILDALDAMPSDSSTQVTCIEPYPDRLFGILREADQLRVDVRAQFIQDVDLSLFATLEAGDILFLDTSHISKSGSDVNYELFTILPILPSGVIIHFHDIFNKFEYPEKWVMTDNRSWNEIYILRAFLMHNSNYEIMLFNDAIAEECRDLKMTFDARFLQDPGGSLWLRKV